MKRRKAAIIVVILTAGVLAFAFFIPVVYYHIDTESCDAGVCQETLGNGYQSIVLNLTEQMHVQRFGGIYSNSGGQPWSYWIFWEGQDYRITH